MFHCLIESTTELEMVFPISARMSRRSVAAGVVIEVTAVATGKAGVKERGVIPICSILRTASINSAIVAGGFAINPAICSGL